MHVYCLVVHGMALACSIFEAGSFLQDQKRARPEYHEEKANGMRGGHRGVRALSCTRTLRARGMIHLGRTVGAGGQGGNLPQHTGDKQLAVALYCHQLCCW